MAAVNPVHAALLMDSIHDFLKPRSGDAANIGTVARRLGEIISEQPVAPRPPNPLLPLLPLFTEISQDPNASERRCEEILAAIPPTNIYNCTVSSVPSTNLQHLNMIFSILGLEVVNDITKPVIHLICDGGPMHLGTLAKNIDHYINIVHTITPATACDSAGVKRGIAFGKPIVFEDGNTGPDTPLLSRAALFSNTTYYETSNIFDTNSTIEAVINISGGDEPIESQTININSSGRGPTVKMLSAAIAARTAGPYALSRFNNKILFDIKRCGDSDQIGHADSLLTRNQDPMKVYVFATLDRICAYIAAKIYNIPTILQTNSGSTKIFTVWKPGAPPMAVVPRGGQIEEGLNRLAEPEFLDFITSLCADKVRSAISKYSPETAAVCSYHMLSRYFSHAGSIPDQLRNDYVERHNAMYARLGWGIYGGWPGGPTIAAKLRSIPPFDYRTLLTSDVFVADLTASAASIMDELNDAYDNRLVEFVADKYVASKACEILLKPVIGILTLALVGDIIQSPEDPGVSVISTVLFNGFLPPIREIPNVIGWTRETQRIYSQLLVAISTKLETRSPLAGDREVLGLIRGGRRRKTFRRKHNGLSKGSRGKSAGRRNSTNSKTHRRRRTADRDSGH
jgi:hypothetical protein